MTPAEFLEKYMGAVQGDARHKEIIDTYNKITPNPGRMNYIAAWCAATVSAAFWASGYGSKYPYSASCNQMIAKAKEKGIWIEDDTYVPQRNDVVIYSWSDKKANFAETDCKEIADHTGVVLRVSNNYIYVGEGNYGKKHIVYTRKLRINGQFIRGFISFNKSNNKSNEEIAKEVIAGKWGAGIVRRQKLTQAGYDYVAVQKIVNQLLK